MKTPTGFRDFPPEQQKLRNQMLKKIEEKFQLYGYSSIDTPAVEFLEVLTAKSGEEVKEQLFRIEGEDIALRFDLTVPLARFVASQLNLYKPFKRYAIAKVWRNEEPQKARYREFIQADVDIVGVKEQTAEVELLLLAEDVLQSLGFSLEKAEFLINNRKFLSSFADYYEVNSSFFFRSIDKLDKIGEKGVLDLLKKEYGEKAEKIMKELISGKNNREKLEFIKGFSEEAYDELSFITKNFEKAKLELTLVRGLDYYTGSIFEVKLSKEIGSVVGGGRYDNLTSIYGKQDYAVGLSLGFERLFYLKLKEEKPEKYNNTNVYIAFIGENFNYALSIAQFLRKKGIAVDINYSKRSLRKQLDYANNMKYKYVIIVGDREREENKAVLRNMDTKEEKKLSKEELLNFLKNVNSN